MFQACFIFISPEICQCHFSWDHFIYSLNIEYNKNNSKNPIRLTLAKITNKSIPMVVHMNSPPYILIFYQLKPTIYYLYHFSLLPTTGHLWSFLTSFLNPPKFNFIFSLHILTVLNNTKTLFSSINLNSEKNIRDRHQRHRKILKSFQ